MRRSEIAKVVSDIALNKEFDYLVPDSVIAEVAVGSRVRIPFGRRQATGYVVGLVDHSDRENLKSILSVSDPQPLLNDRLLALTRWIADYYCASIEQVLRTVLPGWALLLGSVNGLLHPFSVVFPCASSF